MTGRPPVDRWHYFGMLRSAASWSHVAREIIKALDRVGCAVSVTEMVTDRYDGGFELTGLPASTKEAASPAIGLSFEDPRLLRNIRHRPMVSMIVTEANYIPEPWVEPLQRIEKVVVPSHFVLTACRRAGIAGEKLSIVPHGFDPAIFRPRNFRNKSGPVRVLYVGSTAYRKGLDILLNAVERLGDLKDSLTLTLKLTDYPDAAARSYVNNTWRIQVARLAECGFSIDVIEDWLSPKELNRIMVGSDILCQPHRGEGFCLPLLEAAATGMAILTTDWGGALDYLNAHSAVLIPATEEYSARQQLPEPDMWSEDARLFGPTVENVALALAELVESQDTRRRLGRSAQKTTKHLTWVNAAKRLQEVSLDLTSAQVSAE